VRIIAVSGPKAESITNVLSRQRQDKISYDPKAQIRIVQLSNLPEANPSIFACAHEEKIVMPNSIDEVGR
jgi:hypothetical protein